MALPEEDSYRFELIGGEFFMTPPLLPGLSLSLRGGYRLRAGTKGKKAHPVGQTLVGFPAFFGAVPGRFSFGLPLREMEAYESRDPLPWGKKKKSSGPPLAFSLQKDRMQGTIS